MKAKRQVTSLERHTSTPKLRRISDTPTVPSPKNPTPNVALYRPRPLLPNNVPLPLRSLPFDPFGTYTNSCRSHSLTETCRKTLKSKNKNGKPIRLPSKVLALIADPQDAGAVYVAESGGTARRLVLEVGEAPLTNTRIISPASHDTHAKCFYLDR